jgi:hypothetical protein
MICHHNGQYINKNNKSPHERFFGTPSLINWNIVSILEQLEKTTREMYVVK